MAIEVTVTIPRIVNSMVSDAAAIAWSKISKVGARLADVVGADVLPVASGGTGADLSATGGAGKVLKQSSAGAVVTVAALLASDMPSGIDAAKIGDGSVSTTEFQYINSLRSNAQDQIDTKLPKQTTRKTAWVNFWPGNNTPTVVGWLALNTVGTLADGSSANHAGTNISSTTINTIGVRTSASIATHQSRHDPSLTVRLTTGASIANVSFFIGFWSVATTTADSAAQHYGGVRFSTAAGDPGWVGVCNDGVLANHQTSAQIAAIAANTEYVITVAFSGDGSLLTLTINGVSVTMATHLPTTTQGLFPQAQARNLAAEAKAFTLGEFYMEWD